MKYGVSVTYRGKRQKTSQFKTKTAAKKAIKTALTKTRKRKDKWGIAYREIKNPRVYKIKR